MLKKSLTILVLITLFTLTATAQDAKTVVANAIKAAGYDKLNTIEYSGPVAHEGAGLGQWMSATKGWHQNTVQSFTRFIDYNAGTSQRTGMQSRPGDAATGLLPGGAGLDPSTNPPAQNTATVAANAPWANRLDVILSPPAFLKMAAAASNATAKSQSVSGKKYTVISFASDQKAPSGMPYTLTGYINAQNMLEKAQTAYEDTAQNSYMFGDIVVEQTFADYKDFGGVKFPTKITQTRAGVPFTDVTIADVKPNAPAPAAPAAAAAGAGGGGRGGGGGGRGGAAPEGAAAGGGRGGAGGPGAGAGAPGGGRGGAAPEGAAAAGGRGGQGGGGRGGAAAAPPAPRKLADGVYVLTNGYRAMAIEFKDHIVLVEAPQNNIANLIEQAKQAIPNKPITQVISTHMHFDHAAGLRTVAAEGPNPVTIITNEANKGIVEKWFASPRTLQGAPPAADAAPAGGGRGGGAPAAVWPDALQKSGKKVKFQYVKDKLVLKDATQTVEIYPLKGALHAEDMLIVYVPKAKAVFESDAYNPGAPGAATTGTGQLAFQKLLVNELDKLKLDYNVVVSGHPPGDQRDASKQDLMAAIGKK